MITDEDILDEPYDETETSGSGYGEEFSDETAFGTDIDTMATDNVPQAQAESTVKSKKMWQPYRNKLCSQLKELPSSGRFRYSNPSFFMQPDEETHHRRKVTQYVPRTSLELNKRHFETLCAIMILDADSVHWSEVESLVEQLGGSLEPTTGSIDRFYIPTAWSFPTTIHRPHRSKIGLPKAKALNVIFRKWGIQIARFRYVPHY
jgi:hypothetical protein